MSITFRDLIQIYRQSEPIDGSDLRAFYIQTEEQLNMLNQLLSDENCNNTVLSTEDEPKLGSTVNLTFGTPKQQFGRFFNKLDNLINFDIINFSNTNLVQSDFFY